MHCTVALLLLLFVIAGSLLRAPDSKVPEREVRFLCMTRGAMPPPGVLSWLSSPLWGKEEFPFGGLLQLLKFGAVP